MTEGHPLWDRPVRYIHWLILVLLPVCWFTAEFGYLEYHQWAGYAILIAVLTRMAWGIIGSPQARFSDFLRGPGAVLGYLRGTQKARTPGHNPAGGWSAIALWLLLLIQALSGTVNTDDIVFTGPFHYVFESETTEKISALHDWVFNVLLGFIALHLVAIFYHERVKGHRLLRPMVYGSAPDRVGTGPAKPAYRAIVLALILAASLWGLMELAPVPPPSDFFW
ncbi:MAG: cytochrome b/b6 domain-containing protein [Pseudomonadota bacterium]